MSLVPGLRAPITPPTTRLSSAASLSGPANRCTSPIPATNTAAGAGLILGMICGRDVTGSGGPAPSPHQGADGGRLFHGQHPASPASTAPLRPVAPRKLRVGQRRRAAGAVLPPGR